MLALSWNTFSCSGVAWCWTYRPLFFFTFLVWLLLPRWLSFKFCLFLSFYLFIYPSIHPSCFNLQPQPNKSPDDLFLYFTSWWKPAGEWQSFLLQHPLCIWKLHEGGTSLCPFFKWMLFKYAVCKICQTLTQNTIHKRCFTDTKAKTL